MMLSKNVKNKKCAPELVFFNEIKIKKNSYNFWHRKLTFESQILALFDTSLYTNSQNSIISFEYVDS